MRREKVLYEMVNETLTEERMKTVQLIFGKHEGRWSIKMLNVVGDANKEKVKGIMNRYIESFDLVKETSTTLLYMM